MTTVSETSIANMALLSVGAKTVTNIDDENTEAIAVRIYYDIARDAVIEAREWTFAVKRTRLALLFEKPEWGYSHAFQLPPDCLRAIEIRRSNPERVNYRELANRLDWRREGNQIHTDATTADLRYIARVTDPARFSSGFVYALAARLAFEIAVAITQSTKMQENLWKVYEKKLIDAAAVEGMQGRSQVLRSSALTGVRGVGSSVGDW